MFTFVERLALWNQYEILRLLDPGQATSYRVKQEILAQGYEQFYSEIDPGINRETVPPAITAEVSEILNVFRFITFSSNRLKYKPKSPSAQFEGFDGNNEPVYFSAAIFLRQTLGRWQELKDAPDNSHSHALGKYRRMVATWKRLGAKHELSAAEIEEIAEA